MSEGKEDAPGTPFTLRNAGSVFEGRSGDIFGKLDVLERQHISHEQNRTDLERFADLRQNDELVEGCSIEETSPDVERTIGQRKNIKQQGNQDGLSDPGDMLENAEADFCPTKKSDAVTSYKRGEKHAGQSGQRQPLRQEAQFRRPSGRPPGRYPSRIPDHKTRPQNWTYYSLEDVKGSDMSEKSNTQAALAFLDERRKLRENKEEMDLEDTGDFDVRSAACSKGVFSFAKPTKTDKFSGIQVKFGKDKLPASDDDKDRSSSTVVESTTPDAGTEGEATLEEETVESSSSSSKDDGIKAGFKSRKGIKRNIRARDEDD